MLAAIAGDIIGSCHERANIKRTNFTLFKPHSRFTDDTVMTLAVADCLLNRKPYAATLRAYGRRYPDRGNGGMFREWLADDAAGPYQSFGNGSAMRVSPVGFAMRTLDDVMSEARATALPTAAVSRRSDRARRAPTGPRRGPSSSAARRRRHGCGHPRRR